MEGGPVIGKKPLVSRHRQTARRIAYDVLSDYEARTKRAAETVVTLSDTDSSRAIPHVTQLLDDRFAAVDPPLLERRLATELVCGIVRRRATLYSIITKFATRERDRIEDGLWTLLEIGVYQLVMLHSIPAHAAVHETVEICRQSRHPEWTSMLNAVLRTVGRSITNEHVETPTAATVPIGDSFRVFSDEVFADPTESPDKYFSSAYSFPRWIVDQWLARYEEEETVRLMRWYNTPGKMSLRVNQLKTDREKLLDVLKTCEVEAEPGDIPELIRLAHTIRVENIPGFSEGWFAVQDESAMRATLLLDPQPGETILDLCAAPGGKTTHMAERMKNEGRIVACDVNADRLPRVAESAQRLGLSIIETHPITQKGKGIPPASFDAALVDVPCSNTGVLGKRPEVRWRLKASDLTELVPLQLRLLQTAMQKIRPGGRVLYSTCSIEPSENEGVVREALRLVGPSWTLDSERRHPPGRPADGGYQALIRREE